MDLFFKNIVNKFIDIIILDIIRGHLEWAYVVYVEWTPHWPYVALILLVQQIVN